MSEAVVTHDWVVAFRYEEPFEIVSRVPVGALGLTVDGECVEVGEPVAFLLADPKNLGTVYKSFATAELLAEFLEQDRRKRDEEKRRESERRAALPLDDADHWCWFCEDNWYDQDDCRECNGDGCDHCQQHGFVGYSW